MQVANCRTNRVFRETIIAKELVTAFFVREQKKNINNLQTKTEREYEPTRRRSTRKKTRHHVRHQLSCNKIKSPALYYQENTREQKTDRVRAESDARNSTINRILSYRPEYLKLFSKCQILIIHMTLTSRHFHKTTGTGRRAAWQLVDTFDVLGGPVAQRCNATWTSRDLL